MRTHATTAEHLALAPPVGGRWGVPVGFALGVHVLLAMALAWGVNWRDKAAPAAVSAELWSRLPQEAAAAQPESLPAPAPEPPPEPAAPSAPPSPPPEPRRPPVQTPPPPPRASEQAPADIASQRRQQEQREREEARRLEQQRQQKLAQEREAKAEKARADKAEAEKKQQEARAKADADRKRQEDLARRERERAEARQAAARERAEQDAINRNRTEQIQRQMAQLDSASRANSSGAAGQASQSSGPSAGYASRVAARIRPNVRFDDDIAGNPVVEVRVRTLPDGSIVTRSIHKSSGHAGWDQAALRAIDRTGSLPRDTDGRVPPDLIIELRPKDQ